MNCEHEVTEWTEDEETLAMAEVCLDCYEVLERYNPIEVDAPIYNENWSMLRYE